MRRVAGRLARSGFCRRGRELWKTNENNRDLPLSKWDKAWTGAYLVLKDYSEGLFPPIFPDQDQIHDQERNYRQLTVGSTPEEVGRGSMIKPFWFGEPLRYYFRCFIKLTECFEAAGIRPPAKVLEMGGGAGWTSEFLSQFGFRIVSTTISPDDVASGWKRVEALKVKGLKVDLEFVAAPMECVAAHVKDQCPFDAAFVFAALHHAHDWRAAISSAFCCLRPGGWLLVCEEPNVVHTAVSYRVARLTQTHEIGFSKRELIGHMRSTGFQRVISRGKRPHFFCQPHWLLAQR